jgi:molybdopterin adenylyltransferase
MSPSSPTPHEHKAHAPAVVRCVVITVSDTRTIETDSGGQEVITQLQTAGHVVIERQIIPDDPARLRPLLESLRDRDDVDAVLLTGGTGITSRDLTYETVTSLLTKPLPGYGELFRMLSYAEIGSATMLSRATGGLLGRKVLLTMPGSPAAVRLAMAKIIVPELAHLVREARR